MYSKVSGYYPKKKRKEKKRKDKTRKEKKRKEKKRREREREREEKGRRGGGGGRGRRLNKLKFPNRTPQSHFGDRRNQSQVAMEGRTWEGKWTRGVCGGAVEEGIILPTSSSKTGHQVRVGVAIPQSHL